MHAGPHQARCATRRTQQLWERRSVSCRCSVPPWPTPHCQAGSQRPWPCLEAQAAPLAVPALWKAPAAAPLAPPSTRIQCCHASRQGQGAPFPAACAVCQPAPRSCLPRLSLACVIVWCPQPEPEPERARVERQRAEPEPEPEPAAVVVRMTLRQGEKPREVRARERRKREGRENLPPQRTSRQLSSCGIFLVSTMSNLCLFMIVRANQATCDANCNGFLFLHSWRVDGSFRQSKSSCAWAYATQRPQPVLNLSSLPTKWSGEAQEPHCSACA